VTTADCGTEAGGERAMLLVDDDCNLCWVLQRAFERRGYSVKSASSVPQALVLLRDWPVGYAAIDLRLPGPSGLTLIPALRKINPLVRVVMMTGYASIASAVEAIKLGAIHYVAKPVDANMIESGFQRLAGDPDIAPGERPVSVHRLTWEHIHGVLADHHGNISAAARALGMHRRTLQRKLGKHPARR